MKVVFIGLLLITAKTESFKKYMNFYKDKLEMNPKYMVNGSHSMIQEKSIVVINVDFELVLLVKNLTLEVDIQRLDKKFAFLNQRVLICDFLRKNNRSMLDYFLQKMYNVVKNKTNAIVCIHKPGYYYYKNVQFNYLDVVKFAPMGKYVVGINVFEDNCKVLEPVGNYTVFMEVGKR